MRLFNDLIKYPAGKKVDESEFYRNVVHNRKDDAGASEIFVPKSLDPYLSNMETGNPMCAHEDYMLRQERGVMRDIMTAKHWKTYSRERVNHFSSPI